MAGGDVMRYIFNGLPSEGHGLSNEISRRHDLVGKKKNLSDWISMILQEVSINDRKNWVTFSPG
jgi:hypothetical protein